MSGNNHTTGSDYRPLPPRSEDIRELGRRARAGEETARERLIEGLMPLALRRARRFAGPLVPLEEAQAEATAAVIKAVDRFDPDRGPLIPYAERWIVGALRRILTLNRQRREAERGTTRAGWKEASFFRHCETPEMQHRRENLLGNLRPRERSLVEHLLGGGTLAEWARLQRPPISLARASQLQRGARSRLKSLLADEPNPALALRRSPVSDAKPQDVAVKVDLDTLIQQQRGRQWNLTISVEPAAPRQSKPRTFARTGYPSDRR
jgi:RNA polymerase sigma factor (sigma-70 family)